MDEAKRRQLAVQSLQGRINTWRAKMANSVQKLVGVAVVGMPVVMVIVFVIEG